MKVSQAFCLALFCVFSFIVLQPTNGKSNILSDEKSKRSNLGDSNTFFQSKSYQSMIVRNGSGQPISEKKMSAFSVEDHKGGNE